MVFAVLDAPRGKTLGQLSNVHDKHTQTHTHTHTHTDRAVTVVKFLVRTLN